MITEKSVDTESFDEIFHKMRRKVSEIYPEWNDYNYHDPGITLLELFAFLSEAQNYRMNRTPDCIEKNFLRLAFDLPAPAKPAMLSIDLHTSRTVSHYDEFTANGLVFKAQEDITLVADILDAVQVGTVRYTENFHPFTAQPAPERAFTIVLKRALMPEQPYALSVTVREHPNRNPITPDFIPLATMQLFYGDIPIPCTDSTYCFLQNGVIRFQLPPSCATATPQLTCKLVTCDYDVVPWICNLSFSQLTLLQQDTKALFCTQAVYRTLDTRNKLVDFYQYHDGFYQRSMNRSAAFACIYDDDFYHRKTLARGNGFPHQRYRVHGDFLLEPALLVEHAVHKGMFERYTLVEDFECATPTSKCFYVQDNTICFGDGIHGYCPEGEIVIVGLAFTKGEAGNLARGNLLHVSPYHTVPMQHDSHGGCNPQTIAQMFATIPTPTRLVTAEDFEYAIRRTTGLIIADCKTLATPADNTVSVVVQPVGVGTALSPKYKENITKFLEPRRLLGNEIKIFSPTYTEVEIFMEVVRSPLYLDAKAAIHRTLHAYFASQKTFGAITEYSVLYQKIDALEEIVEIHAFHITARGDGVQRNRKGDVITLANSITLLKNVDIMVDDML